MFRVIRGNQALVGYYGSEADADGVARSEAMRTGSRHRVDKRPIGGKWSTLRFVQPTRPDGKWGHADAEGKLV